MKTAATADDFQKLLEMMAEDGLTFSDLIAMEIEFQMAKNGQIPTFTAEEVFA